MSSWLIEIATEDEEPCRKVVYGDSLLEALAWFISHNPEYTNLVLSISNYDT